MTDVQPAESTSTNLLERLIVRDSQAWGRFAAIYTPLVFRWAKGSGLQSADVADVTQDVFRVVATKLQSFERTTSKQGSFRRWLWGITRNILRQHFDANSKTAQGTGGTTAHRLITAVPDYLESDEPPHDADAEKSLVHRALKAIEGDFQPHTWKAFWRMTVEQQSANEIADSLGMTPRAVRQAKYRVLSRLREELLQ
ncbi:RNA polymerase sigma factor [Stieleria varia]|uniref:RNA polymerase sigma factor SigD n=1 Tax=Stieleria varia TaxID=2528005 RepID=A0A5C6AFE2_9BACT|nr:sigma-70 family RNA polymerase sigma factor [Stieleria varia]TWT98329.1 RNA polymerase sigma factor SigD [Stieleria varia]